MVREVLKKIKNALEGVCEVAILSSVILGERLFSMKRA